MAFEHEKRTAARLLEGIEDGTLSTSDAAYQVKEADPTLVYLLFTWLRENYRAEHPAAAGVIGRIVSMVDDDAEISRMVNEGKADSLVTWFEETYSYRDLEGGEFISIIVEKLES